ncbi:MAG: hypothetical protein AAGU32_14500 [Bacillota bacterium]
MEARREAELTSAFTDAGESYGSWCSNGAMDEPMDEMQLNLDELYKEE